MLLCGNLEEAVRLLALILWWGCIALEAALLVRAIKEGLQFLYPFFYSYLAWVLTAEVARFLVYSAHRNSYQTFYWYTQFPTIILGYGVLLEMYRRALQNFPGADRLARTGLIVTLALVLCKVFVHPLGGVPSLPVSTPELERNLRTVQAALIFVLLGVLSYYAIPISRNLKGVILGYGFFVSASVINLTLRLHFGEGFRVLWDSFYSSAYLVTLVIWCVTLWSFQPSPDSESQSSPEHDYLVLARATKRLLATARGYLLRAVRP